MSWLKIILETKAENSEAVEAALEAAGAVAVTTEAADTEAVFATAQDTSPVWQRTRLIGLFAGDTDADAIRAALYADLGDQGFTQQSFEYVADQDWERAWMERFQPIQCDGNLWIIPSWCAPPDPGATNIIMDPGLAFGSGTHATTRLCLNWLVRQPLAGKAVLDYGCGSGILAIAALRLGARHALGVDIDSRSIVASLENAARNDVARTYTAVLPEELTGDYQADIVVANILAGTLIDLADVIGGRVAPGGALVLSGMLVNQAESVRAHYPSFDLAVTTMGEWAMLSGCGVSDR